MTMTDYVAIARLFATIAVVCVDVLQANYIQVWNHHFNPLVWNRLELQCDTRYSGGDGVINQQ